MTKSMLFTLASLFILFNFGQVEGNSNFNIGGVSGPYYNCPGLNRFENAMQGSMSQLFINTIVFDQFYLNSKIPFVNYKAYSTSEYFGQSRKGELQTNLTVKGKLSDMGFEISYYSGGINLCQLNRLVGDRYGNITEHSEFNSLGQLQIRKIYKYNLDSRMIMQTHFNAQGEILRKYVFKYENNKCIEIISYNEKSLVENKWTYTYDKERNQITENQYNSAGIFTGKVQEIYDERQILIESLKINDKKEVENKFKFQTDSRGNLNSISSWNNSSNLWEFITFKYQFNDSGFWTTKTTYKSKSEEVIGQPVLIEERNFIAQTISPKQELSSDDIYDDNTKTALISNSASDPFVYEGDQIQHAKFPGGDGAFKSFIVANFEYPERCRNEGIEGRVELKFVVDINGRISRIQIIQQPRGCPELGQEAIRVLQRSPPWIPAIKDGMYVNAWHVLPINLTLQ